jgi:hypothetical protein
VACDVLNLEWSSSGRDREVASAICHALRRRGYTVVEECIFNYRYHLLRYRPRLLYLADPTGARMNQEVSLFADRRGIPSVCVDAEGDYRDDAVDAMFWGHIADRRLRQRVKLQWSVGSRASALTVAPDLGDRLKVTGAVGFDRYRLYHFASKDDWRRKYRFEQTRIVGVAAWSFDYLFVPSEREARIRSLGRETVERFQRDRDSLRAILGELIRRRPDTKFVLKLHPGVIDFGETEFAGLERYDNVLLLKDEESVGDCISACDVWMAYNSTTCTEAWMLGKPTLFVNPSGADFPRSRNYLGTPVFETLSGIEGALSEHEDNGRISAFDALEDARTRLLTDMVQWVDGRNHLRAAHYIERVLDEIPAAPARFPLSERLVAHAENLLNLGARRFPSLPGLRQRARVRQFDRAEVRRIEQRLSAATESMPDELSEQELAELELVNS